MPEIDWDQIPDTEERRIHWFWNHRDESVEVHKFKDESLAVEFLKDLISPCFRLMEQVSVQHPYLEDRGRIDLVAMPKFDWPNVKAIGFEVKSRANHISLVSDHIAQCSHYAVSKIIDKRPVPESLDYVFAFPCPNEHLYATERIAGKFNVGFLFTWFDPRSRCRDWELRLSGESFMTYASRRDVPLELCWPVRFGNFGKSRKVFNH